jgi:hypothetical protein
VRLFKFNSICAVILFLGQGCSKVEFAKRLPGHGVIVGQSEIYGGDTSLGSQISSPLITPILINGNSNSQNSPLPAGNYVCDSNPLACRPGIPNVLILNTSNKVGALSLFGSANFQINGQLTINSSSTDAILLSGTSSLGASNLEVVGSIPKNFSNHSLIPISKVKTGLKPMADPFNLPSPVDSDLVDVAIRTSGSFFGGPTIELDPGLYQSNLFLSGSAKIKFKPGTYYFKDGLTINGNAVVEGIGVTLVLMGGGISISGESIIKFWAPIDESAEYGPQYAGRVNTGIVIFQPRYNTSQVFISGQPLIDLRGVVYVPNANFSVNGQYSNLSPVYLICDTASLNGQGVVLGY